MSYLGRLLALSLIVALPFGARSHEVRPGFLELAVEGGRYVEVTWKAPMRGDAVLSIRPVLPAACRDRVTVSRRPVPGAIVERRSLDCGPGGLAGETIAIEGLERTLTDVVVRVADDDGRTWSRILKPHAASFAMSEEPPWTDLAASYLRYGVEHILLGIDHLLFVLGLLLIVRGRWRLVETITAFTVAHSITLGLATLGFVNVPQAPVEAVIALSIVFLASELLRQNEGQPTLTQQRPWIVAFAFGLLHGLGFASALRSVGLPPGDVPLALLLFNLGVELGQLAFVAVVLSTGALAWRLSDSRLPPARRAAAYGIGSISAFWVIQRLALILASA